MGSAPALPSAAPVDAASALAILARAAADAGRAALADVDPAAAVADVVARASEAAGAPPAVVAAEVLDRALADPVFAHVTPDLALQSYAVLIAGATLAETVTIWRQDVADGLRLVAQTPDAVEDRARVVARAVVAREDRRLEGRGTFAAAVLCHGVVGGALVVELGDGDERFAVPELVDRAAERLALLLERVSLLDNGTARERVLVEASERRLVRLGYDLHDGPLQSIAAVGAEIRFLAADVERLVSDEAIPAVREGFASLTEELRRVEAGLRAVARSSETSAAVSEPLVRAISREVDQLGTLTPIVVHRVLEEEPPGLSDSQRIAIYRVVQEALANVREHSGATEVHISFGTVGGRATLRVSDNGRGFDVDAEAAAARRRGRLGLVGISERIRLLGGAVHITSSRGAGTTLELALTPWARICSGE